MWKISLPMYGHLGLQMHMAESGLAVVSPAFHLALMPYFSATVKMRMLQQYLCEPDLTCCSVCSQA